MPEREGAVGLLEVELLARPTDSSDWSSTPSGSSRAAASASSPQPSALAGTPATPTVPASVSMMMSSTPASRTGLQAAGLVDQGLGGFVYRRTTELQ
ncbi:MAG: hypothetical protein R2710_00870 [Acidimicrobiales bacterium]